MDKKKKKNMDGWMDKKNMKKIDMVGWIKMDGWMDKKIYEKRWMVGWIKKKKKIWMVGWMEKKYGWLDG